jgi:hypothetical protein
MGVSRPMYYSSLQFHMSHRKRGGHLNWLSDKEKRDFQWLESRTDIKEIIINPQSPGPPIVGQGFRKICRTWSVIFCFRTQSPRELTSTSLSTCPKPNEDSGNDKHRNILTGSLQDCGEDREHPSEQHCLLSSDGISYYTIKHSRYGSP